MTASPDTLDSEGKDAVPQPHDPKAPLVLVRSKLATARATG